MSWTQAVMCTPCKGPAEWVIINGSWTCWACKTPMSAREIKHMQDAQTHDRVG